MVFCYGWFGPPGQKQSSVLLPFRVEYINILIGSLSLSLTSTHSNVSSSVFETFKLFGSYVWEMIATTKFYLKVKFSCLPGFNMRLSNEEILHFTAKLYPGVEAFFWLWFKLERFSGKEIGRTTKWHLGRSRDRHRTELFALDEMELANSVWDSDQTESISFDSVEDFRFDFD